MGEDQHAAGARGLDEAERRHRLAGSGGVLEPEPLGRVGVLGLLIKLDVRVEAAVLASPRAPRPVGLAVLVLGLVVVLVEIRSRSSSGSPSSPGIAAEASSGAARRGSPRRAAPVPVSVAPLRLGEQRGERPRQRVDLVGREHGAVDEVRLVLREQALEPEQQRELAPPLDRGLLGVGLDLGQGRVERPAPGGAGCERFFERLAFIYEALTREQLGTGDRRRTRKRGGAPIKIERLRLECEPRQTSERLRQPQRGQNDEESPESGPPRRAWP